MTVWKPTTTPEDVIMHSAKGTTWKNHKYLKKIGNAYVYAKNASSANKRAKKYNKEFEKTMNEDFGLGDKEVENVILGRRDGYDRPISKSDKEKYYGKNGAYNQLPGEFGKVYRDHEDRKQRAADQYLAKERQERTKSYYEKKSRDELKSLANDIKSDIKSIGKKKKKKSTKSKTRSTITDTFTGKTRSAKKPTSAADTINIKQLSEKNKKKRRR